MRLQLLCGTAAIALLTLSQAASANTLVATIVGAYDAECTSTCITGNPNITNYASSGGNTFDTPSLFILNPTGQTFTNVQVKLTGYQDAANGGTGVTYQSPGPGPAATETLSLPNIAANTVYQLIWGSGGLTVSNQSGNNLFQYDYDDELGNIAGSGTGDPAGNHCGTNDTHNPNICAFVGNFDVSFSALLGGTTAISSVFSPDNLQGGGNVSGGFVGWEGLDADGLSETFADTHTNTFPGTLANIFTGTNQNGGGGGPTGVPEPASLTMIAAGLGALAFTRRRRKTS